MTVWVVPSSRVTPMRQYDRPCDRVVRQRKPIEPSPARVNDDCNSRRCRQPDGDEGLEDRSRLHRLDPTGRAGVTMEPSARRAVTLTGNGTPATPAPATGLEVSTFENGTRSASTA